MTTGVVKSPLIVSFAKTLMITVLFRDVVALSVTALGVLGASQLTLTKTNAVSQPIMLQILY